MSTATTTAADAVLAAILPSYGMDTDPAEVPALRRNAAVGIAHALRVMARASAPGERFTLTSWADQFDHQTRAKRKASR